MASEEIRRLQALLNRVGGLLATDGVTGPETRRATADARALAGLPPGEAPDRALLDWLAARPEPSPDLPTRGVVFIACEEVDGRDCYDAHTAQPHWPGGDSGITIGVGYDLRFSTAAFEGDWGGRLGADELAALRPHLGARGSAREAEALSWIRIPWSVAWQVFIGCSLPTNVDKAGRAYTTFRQLPGLCRSVLVSLVLNRGSRLEDRPGKNTRKEMRAIRDLLLAGDLEQVPDQLLSMQRLWPSSSGLRGRRAREAALWQEGLGAA